MKDKYKIIAVLIFITIFACIPYCTPDLVVGNDIAYHLNRIIALSSEIKNGSMRFNTFGFN